jgi:hypothetical protein
LDEAVSLVEDLVTELITVDRSSRTVRRALDWLRINANPLFVKPPAKIRTTECRNCGEPIFFGRKRDDRWLALSPLGVKSDAMLLGAITLEWTNIGPNPLVKDAVPGIQWFTHNNFCLVTQRPSDPLMGAMWERLNGVEGNEVDSAIESLRRLLGAQE